MLLTVPPVEASPWPSLGGDLADWIEDHLVYGPGDLLGQPYRLTPEKLALLYRCYEVYPRGHEFEGRRRFKRAAISLRKGTAKTEFAAIIAACELHPEAPVRCVSWRGEEPEGAGVDDPYIPMVAYTEEMSEELAYGALLEILGRSALARDFDLGVERIMRARGAGKAVPLATSPSARDGARTTFQHFDETHRLILKRHKDAHRTMLANIPKRRKADAWSLETTTAPSPGEESVAEGTMEYAREIHAGRIADPRLFFYHREAGSDHDLATDEGLRAAILEASGPDAEWSDIEAIVSQFLDPQSDPAYSRRVWLNQLVRDAGRAFDAEKFAALADPEYTPKAGALIVAGFDGSRREDSTALVAKEIRTGYEWIHWLEEKPAAAAEAEGWEVKSADVTAAVDDLFTRFNVWRLYADPWGWGSELADWESRYGGKRGGKIHAWETNRWVAMASAVKEYADGIERGDFTHSGDPRFIRHVGNACKRTLTIRDDKGEALWVIQKERPESPMKIDAAMAAILAREAWRDAIAAGMAKPPRPRLSIDADTGAEAAKPEFAGMRGQEF